MIPGRRLFAQWTCSNTIWSGGEGIYLRQSVQWQLVKPVMNWLFLQVETEGYHHLVRATACDCLREIELAFPVRVNHSVILDLVFSEYPRSCSVFSEYPIPCSVFLGYTELQARPFLRSESGRKFPHLPTLPGEKYNSQHQKWTLSLYFLAVAVYGPWLYCEEVCVGGGARPHPWPRPLWAPLPGRIAEGGRHHFPLVPLSSQSSL